MSDDGGRTTENESAFVSDFRAKLIIIEFNVRHLTSVI